VLLIASKTTRHPILTMPIAVKKRRNDQHSPTMPAVSVMPCAGFPIASGTHSTAGGASNSSVFFPTNLEGYTASGSIQHYELDVSPRSCESTTSFQCFNTRSPPILDLSPNLSPASRREGLIGTPVFELRTDIPAMAQGIGDSTVFFIVCFNCHIIRCHLTSFLEPSLKLPEYGEEYVVLYWLPSRDVKR